MKQTFDPKNPQTWLSKSLFLSYAGSSPDIEKFYDKAVAKKNTVVIHWDWFAILLLPAWLGYRKLWGSLIAFLGLFSALPFLERLLDFTIPSAAFLGVHISLGLFANSVLLLSGCQLYWKYKAQNLSEQKIAENMKDKAKGSWVIAIVALAISLAVGFASDFIASFI